MRIPETDSANSRHISCQPRSCKSNMEGLHEYLSGFCLSQNLLLLILLVNRYLQSHMLFESYYLISSNVLNSDCLPHPWLYFIQNGTSWMYIRKWLSTGFYVHWDFEIISLYSPIIYSYFLWFCLSNSIPELTVIMHQLYYTTGFYICLCSYLYQRALYFYVLSCCHLASFYFNLKGSISHRAGLMIMNTYSFYLFESITFSFIFESFIRYSILSRQFLFSFRTLNISLHFLLAYSFCLEICW